MTKVDFLVVLDAYQDTGVFYLLVGEGLRLSGLSEGEYAKKLGVTPSEVSEWVKSGEDVSQIRENVVLRRLYAFIKNLPE